ncbi:MAG: 4-hydroxy-tetrahydrodipicolinate synthase [Clostridia bacterium]|nr:4-hydroxy-tetrahydrodipicolinate synthase [Clostridia bacterium]
MKNNPPFKGCATALVTPFLNGEIDKRSFGKLIERQIASGVSALVIGGTTGECATLGDKEREELYRYAVEVIDGRVKVILGNGTNDTRVAISHTKLAESLGADAVLTVTPYYNKGTKNGILSHYEAIANATKLPIILYNVPSRTGVNLSLDMLGKLAEIDNIVALKEASDSLDRLVDLTAVLGDKLAIYSGNDTQLFPTLALGGEGIISVLSNLMPREVEEVCRAYFQGDIARSRALANATLPLSHALFTDTNPSPVKYALSKLGLCRSELRLPLAEPSPEVREKIDQHLSQYSLL